MQFEIKTTTTTTSLLFKYTIFNTQGIFSFHVLWLMLLQSFRNIESII